MDLASWMKHEDERTAEMKKIMAREERKPLMIVCFNPVQELLAYEF